MGSHYTFGDSPVASRRLTLLADVYDRPTRAFLRRGLGGLSAAGQAVDLGCGPGHTTAMLAEVLAEGDRPCGRVTGVDISDSFVAAARTGIEGASRSIDFLRHDLRRPGLPLPEADVLFERFLLTHLEDPAEVLRLWGTWLVPRGRLLVQEVETLTSDDPVMARYYELLAVLQRHYGQSMTVGSELGPLARSAGLGVIDERVTRFEPPGRSMAELHLLNVRTWRQDQAAQALFDPADLDAVDAGLAAIVAGRVPEPAVRTGLAELVVAPHRH